MHDNSKEPDSQEGQPLYVQCYGYHQCGSLNKTLVKSEQLKTEGGPKAETCTYLCGQLDEDVGEGGNCSSNSARKSWVQSRNMILQNCL